MEPLVDSAAPVETLLREVQLSVRGVLRVASGAGPKETQVFADDFEGPNGLCSSPDLEFLHVNDTPRKHIPRFEMQPDGQLAGGVVFADFAEDGPGALDGMECDSSGNVRVTGPGGMCVIDPDGVSIGVLPVPEQPGGPAWGGPGLNELFITARTSLYGVETKVQGCHPVA